THRVSICKSERCDVLITLCAPDRALADAFDDSLRIFGTAVRTDARDERVARKPAFHRLVMSGSGSNRSDPDRIDFDCDRIADFRTFDEYRLCHFMTAFQFRRDHRSPAPRRRI